MKIKEILSSDKSLLNTFIIVNGEPYDERKHGNLIHIDTSFDTHEEYCPTFNIKFYRSCVNFTAIELDKILNLLESKDKDTDNPISAYMDKRIKEIAKE